MARSRIGIHSLLASALDELEQQQRQIEEQIQALRGVLGRQGPRRGRPPGPAKKHGRRGVMSAAARKRIADAQRRRWAEYRKSAAGSAKGE